VINSVGLWEHEYAFSKPENVYRIAFIGGSLGNDPTVEKRYHQLVSESLNNDPGFEKRIETINVSCEGYNTQQQVRLLEKVGLSYQPDLVVVSYQMTDPFRQNGGRDRVGNSRWLFRYWFDAHRRLGSRCSLLEGLYGSAHEYGFQLTVTTALERLKLLSVIHDFDILTAVMPVVAEFDDPVCVALYDKVVVTNKELSIPVINVPEELKGEPIAKYEKTHWEMTHPNQAGHHAIARVLSEGLAAHMRKTELASKVSVE
jgi:hypothetical protein